MPWKDVKPPRGPVEEVFLRPVLLGESIAPFRGLAPLRAVIPWDEDRHKLIDAEEAEERGYSRLAQWLERTEALWEEQKKSAMTHLERIDYHGELSCQLPVSPIRVVYATSGTIPAAFVVTESTEIVDSSLYWAMVSSLDEADYLCGVLNSEALRAGVARYQAQGQWGARHFHKFVFNLPIPRYDGEDDLHRRLAEAARTAEDVASLVPLKEGEHFRTSRKRIRTALKEHGISGRLEKMVAVLLQ